METVEEKGGGGPQGAMSNSRVETRSLWARGQEQATLALGPHRQGRPGQDWGWRSAEAMWEVSGRRSVCRMLGLACGLLHHQPGAQAEAGVGGDGSSGPVWPLQSLGQRLESCVCSDGIMLSLYLCSFFALQYPRDNILPGQNPETLE